METRARTARRVETTEIWFRIARERERATAYMIHDAVPLPGASPSRVCDCVRACAGARWRCAALRVGPCRTVRAPGAGPGKIMNQAIAK